MAVAQTEKELMEASAKTLHDARAIHERALAEKRDMSAEEREQFDRAMDTLEEHGKQLDQLTSDRDDEDKDDEDRDDEDKGGESEKKDDDSERDCKERSNRIERLHAQLRSRSTGRISRTELGEDRDFRSSKRYRTAYRNWLRNGTEHRDLTLGDGTGAGYLVTPVKLAEDIITKLNNLCFIRQMADVAKVTDARSLGNPQLTADIQAVTWGSDETSVSSVDTTMDFGRRDLTPILVTNLAKISWRELQARADVEAFVASRIALSFAYGEEQQYMTGDGSGHPLGVFVASANGIPTSRDVTATGASHSIAADDLFNMVYSIPQQYQNSKNFCWALHRDAVKQVVKLKDGNGQYIWSQGGYTYGLQTNRGQNLLGFPVCQSEFAPNTFSTNAYIAVLGDFTYYRIAETQDMEIQRLSELYAAAGKIGFLARKFLDASPVLADAFARLKLS